MNDWTVMIAALGIGGLLGVFFYGGLWWTVRKALNSSWSTLWVFGSMVVRCAVVMTGFYLIARDHWERLLVCLLGFMLARVLVSRYVKKQTKRVAVETPGGSS